MSFAAKGEKKSTKSKQTPNTVLQKLSPKPTPGPIRLTPKWRVGRTHPV